MGNEERGNGESSILLFVVPYIHHQAIFTTQIMDGSPLPAAPITPMENNIPPMSLCAITLMSTGLAERETVLHIDKRKE